MKTPQHKKRKPIRIAISGCCGRMGSLILEEALKDQAHFELVGGLEHEGHPHVGKPMAGSPQIKVSRDLKNLLQQADLLIEFTTPEASILHAQAAAKARVPMLVGTTGFSTDQLAQLKELAKQIPIFWSPNMSIGIFIVRKTIGSIFNILHRYQLDESTMVRISEVHHTRKKDAPSGTAKQLQEDVLSLSGKPPSEVPIKHERVGDVVGLHTIHFDLGPELIRLEHEALDRRVFALGTLLAARHFPVLAKSNPGWYTMDDLFNSSVTNTL